MKRACVAYSGAYSILVKLFIRSYSSKYGIVKPSPILQPRPTRHIFCVTMLYCSRTFCYSRDEGEKALLIEKMSWSIADKYCAFNEGKKSLAFHPHYHRAKLLGIFDLYSFWNCNMKCSICFLTTQCSVMRWRKSRATLAWCVLYPHMIYVTSFLSEDLYCRVSHIEETKYLKSNPP